MLHLTQPGTSHGGAIIKYGLVTPHARAFDVHFEVALHRPEEASRGTLSGGVSFIYGPLADHQYLDDRGHSVGLSLQMLPADGLQLLSDGLVVAWDLQPSSNGWTPTRVQSNGTHVNVSQNGVLVLPNVRVNVGPETTQILQPRWHFGFGGRATGVTISHKVTNLQVRSIGLLPQLTTPLRESANGQQYSDSRLSFSWFLPPVVSTASPSSGPRYGECMPCVPCMPYMPYIPRVHAVHAVHAAVQARIPAMHACISCSHAYHARMHPSPCMHAHNPSVWSWAGEASTAAYMHAMPLSMPRLHGGMHACHIRMHAYHTASSRACMHAQVRLDWS